MEAGADSLRSVVEKWLCPNPLIPVRIAEFSRTRSNHRRYVRVEAVGPTGSHELFFFRHEDGTWCVFPSEGERPVMGRHWLLRATNHFQCQTAVSEVRDWSGLGVD
jgi:hypothetical protein